MSSSGVVSIFASILSLSLSNPFSVAVSTSGDVIIADTNHNTICKVSRKGKNRFVDIP